MRKANQPKIKCVCCILKTPCVCVVLYVSVVLCVVLYVCVAVCGTVCECGAVCGTVCMWCYVYVLLCVVLCVVLYVSVVLCVCGAVCGAVCMWCCVYVVLCVVLCVCGAVCGVVYVCANSSRLTPGSSLIRNSFAEKQRKNTYHAHTKAEYVTTHTYQGCENIHNVMMNCALHTLHSMCSAHIHYQFQGCPATDDHTTQ